VPGPLTYGNAAKLYCLELLDEAASRAAGRLRIVDLGCGDARNFVELIRRRPQIEYVGIEPSPAQAEAARRALPAAEIVSAPAYDVRREPGDAAISFSVLEHVVDRRRYLETLRAHVAPGGRGYLNYDVGHFTVDLTPAESARAAIGRALARLGNEQHYRRPVSEDELSALLDAVGFRIVDDKGFNTDLKLSYRQVANEHRDRFMREWLACELALNETGISWESGVFRTRNLVLEPR
jgi:SAM-dependent methyltransferase